MKVLTRKSRCFCRKLETLEAVISLFVDVFNKFGSYKAKHRIPVIHKDTSTSKKLHVDVLDGHREAGVGAVLTNRLAIEIMCRGYVTYYGATSYNIASQHTAYRAGFSIGWMCMYRGRFDGFMTATVS